MQSTSFSQKLSPRWQMILVIGVITLLSIVVNSAYRGICHDEGLGTYRAGGLRIFQHQPVLAKDQGIGDTPDPARFLYMAFIALGYQLVGVNLLALHLFPFLFQLINPALFFLVVSRFYKSLWWGFGGALLFLAQPFNLVFLNQQHSHPFFVCWLLLMILLVDAARQQPRWLLLIGVLASLLVLTRFEDGLMFVVVIAAAYVWSQWKHGIPWRWVGGGLLAFIATHALFAWVFRFPLLYPLDYLPILLRRQARYGSTGTFLALTKRAFRYFLNWYFCGKIAAIGLGLLGAIGAIRHLKQRVILPLLLFLPYFAFLLFVYNGRYEIINLPVTTFSVPGFLLLVISGIQGVQHYPLWARWQRWIGIGIFCLIIIAFARSTYSLAVLVEDSQPASTLWRIIAARPPLPGNPNYQEVSLSLGPTERMSVPLREELFRAVRGNYRSWYLHTIGKNAFEQGLPEQAAMHADWVYIDDYETKDRWERDRSSIAGTSPLWNEEFSGRIGAFPYGKDGTFTYQFDFPRPIGAVTIADIHTQWGPGDVTKLRTSTDGEHWTLRHHNWNVHYREDAYYQFFAQEFEGRRTLFLKYEFTAGDRTRVGNDNRGASLDKFMLMVTYQD